MTVKSLQLIAAIAFGLAGIGLLTAVILWFAWNIPRIRGELSGKLAKQSLQALREENRKKGYHFYGSSSMNLKRGKVTMQMPITDDLLTAEETELLEKNKITEQLTAAETEQLPSYIETQLLLKTRETAPLSVQAKEERAGHHEEALSDWEMLTDIVITHAGALNRE